MTRRHILLRLDAPLMSFGGVAIDQHGVTDRWPSASLLTGLIGNALGWRRTDDALLQSLQDRLVFACRLDRTGSPLRDFQTAELAHNDKGWTTRGAPEGRAGGAGTYEGKHIRYRHFWADRVVTIALRLDPADQEPKLDAIAAALERPARPLFIGRKPCLPSGPVFAGWAEGDTALAALQSVPAIAESDRQDDKFLAYWPAREAADHPHDETRAQHGRRNWIAGVHGGPDLWHEGRVARAAPGT